MSSRTDVQYKIIKVVTPFDSACPAATSYAFVNVGSLNWVNPGVALYRPKPAIPALSPTPWGPFYRELHTAKVEKVSGGPIYTWCGPARVQASTEGYTFTNVTAGFLAVPMPPWQIDLRNKIKSERVNMAETIGEWRETARAVDGGAYALRDAWRFIRTLSRQPRHLWPIELRHLFSRRDKLTVHDVPAAYLATVFGIMPWVTLAQNSAEAVQLSATKPIVKRFAVTRRECSEKTTSHSGGGSLVQKTDLTVRAVAYVRFKADVGAFTSGNAAEAIWAGVPFSFMVDWFLSVGSWLSAIDAMDGVMSTIGTVTVRSRSSYKDDRLTAYVPPTYNGWVEKPAAGLRTEYQRSTFGSIGLPPVLEWKNSANFGKLASSLALLHQLRFNSRVS